MPFMRSLFFTLFLTVAVASARGAAVVLKGGGRLEGEVVSATDREVVLDTSQGRVSIDAARVATIDYGRGGPPRREPAPFPSERRSPRPEPLFDPARQSLSLDVGLAAPLSDVDFTGIGGGSAGNGEVGPLVGLQYLYYASPRVGVGLELNYYDRGVAESPSLVPSSFSRAFGDSLLLLGDVKCSLTDRGAVRPYVLLGAGAHRTTTTVDAHPAAGFAWSDTGTNETRRLADGGSWGPAASVRLGLDFGFADPRVFGLEAGWTGLANAGYRATPQGRALGLSDSSGMLNYFTLAGRWGWTF